MLVFKQRINVKNWKSSIFKTDKEIFDLIKMTTFDSWFEWFWVQNLLFLCIDKQYFKINHADNVGFISYKSKRIWNIRSLSRKFYKVVWHIIFIYDFLNLVVAKCWICCVNLSLWQLVQMTKWRYLGVRPAEHNWCFNTFFNEFLFVPLIHTPVWQQHSDSIFYT